MTRPSAMASALPRWAPWLWVAPTLLGLGGCAHRRPAELSAPVRISVEVREILTEAEPSPAFYRARSRIEEMGPEVDAVLVALARDPEAKPVARANALILLADRRSPAALPVLRRALLSEERAALRAAAVLGLQRLLPVARDSVENLIRSAVGDPARIVRLNALQALDIRDVETIRSVLERETDPEVRQVALQLVSLAESRGAPLAPDRRGALRTAGTDADPQIVFRPVRTDSLAGTAVGDLRVELPNAPDIPLAPLAEVVAGVVPAFFSPDRSRVVYEAAREIHVVDLKSRKTVSLGEGIAPRPVPFTYQFVFLRPSPRPPRPSGEGTELRYAVFRGSFGGERPERIGELTAVARMERHANYSPVRWMVVGETPEGFELRGEGVSTFALPSPIWRPTPPDSAAPRGQPGSH